MDDGSLVAKRQYRKAAIKSGWWRRGAGADDVDRELLEAVAILNSLHSSQHFCDELLEAVAILVSLHSSQPFASETCLPAAASSA